MVFLVTGALGVMFEYGIGVRRDGEASFKCLKEAASRGNVYAQGNLAVHYFRRKLWNKAADVAKRYLSLKSLQGNFALDWKKVSLDKRTCFCVS